VAAALLAIKDARAITETSRVPGARWKKSSAGCKLPFCSAHMFWIRPAICLLLFLSAVTFAQEIPPGTVVPIMLSSDLNSKKDGPGKRIDGKVMQDVSLISGQVSKGARVSGHVVSVIKPGASGSNVVLRFDNIQDRGRSIRWTAALLALASLTSVSDAQSPINNTGTSKDAPELWVTRQVGGDIVNREQHLAGSPGGAVGTWLDGSSVMIKLTPNPDVGCPDGPAYRSPQAVWIFSSAACGAYGFKDLVIVSSGAEGPAGEITLGSSENVNVRGGSGWLLVTVAGQ